MTILKENKSRFLKFTINRIIILIGFLLVLLFYLFNLYDAQPSIFNTLMEIISFIKKNEYFESIINLCIGIIGLVLTLISIFGVGVSKAVLTMEKHNINQYLNYILDLIILSILAIASSIYLNHTFKLQYNNNFIIYFNLIYIIILVATIISLLTIIALTFMMYAINLLSYEEQENNKKEKEQEDALFLSDMLISIKSLQGKVDHISKILSNKDNEEET